MRTSSFLPKLLQRVAEVAIGLVLLTFLLTVVYTAFLGEGLGLPLRFTPEAEAYRITSDAWGVGVIGRAEGAVEFEDPGPVLVAWAIVVVGIWAAPALTILILLRRILRTIVAGNPFSAENGPRIRWIGILALATGVILQVTQWVGARFLMSSVAADGLLLERTAQADPSPVFFGLVIIALAEVFARGSRLQLESDFTV